MRAALDAEFGKDSSDSGEEDPVPDNSADASAATPPDDLFCPACNKLFKSTKA